MAQRHRVRIPARITVGPYEFEVRFRGSLHNGDGAPLLGQCDYVHGEIAIDPTAGLSQQAETFVHELLHAVSYACDAGLEEEQIIRLSKGMTAMFNTHGWPESWADRRGK